MKYLGAVANEVFTSGAEAYALQVFTRVLGIEEEEAKKWCEEGLACIKTQKEHRYHLQWQIVGKKPAAEEAA